MHILHVYKDYYPVLGGIENHVKVLAEAQAAQGHHVTVLVTNPTAQTVTDTLNGVHVVKVGRFATVASTPLSPGLLRQLRALPADITHLHAPYPVGEVAQWLAGRGRTYILTYHADVTRPVQQLIMRLYGPLFRHILRGAARILPTSANYARTSPWLQHVQDRLTVVPLGVDITAFSPVQTPSSPAPARPPTLLFVGAMRHYKGLDDALHALTRLPTEVRLLVAGTGPMRAEWEALSQQLQLGPRVQFLGKVPDAELPALYRSADVFVLPANSRAEAFGTVLIEAMASGLPCITTEVGSGTSFVVQHEVTGLVVPPHDPPALAAAVQRLITDNALRTRCAEAARARVLEHFTVQAMLRQVAAVYAAVAPKA